MNKATQWIIGIIAVLALGAGITFLIMFIKQKQNNSDLTSSVPDCPEDIKKEIDRLKSVIKNNPYGSDPIYKDSLAKLLKQYPKCADAMLRKLAGMQAQTISCMPNCTLSTNTTGASSTINVGGVSYTCRCSDGSTSAPIWRD